MEVELEVDGRLCRARPWVKAKVQAGAGCDPPALSSDVRAFKNTAMHASFGCGADALPQNGAAARRLQRGGTRGKAKKAKETKQQEAPCHAAAPVPDGPMNVDGLLEHFVDSQSTVEADPGSTDEPKESELAMSDGDSAVLEVQCASDCKTTDAKEMVSAISYGDALDEVDETQYLLKPVAKQIGQEILNAKQEWELEKASVFAGVSDEELYEKFLDWKDQRKSIKMDELAKTSLALSEFSRKLQEWEDEFIVAVWGAA